MTAGIISDEQGRLLIVQRPIPGLLGGLWKFPGGEKVAGKTLEISLQKAINAELGLKVRVTEELTSVNHAYTHFRMTLHAFRSAIKFGKPVALKCDDWRWVEPEILSNFPFSNADRKVMAVL
jgi:A/G-specific adenine glycosylase